MGVCDFFESAIGALLPPRWQGPSARLLVLKMLSATLGAGEYRIALLIGQQNYVDASWNKKDNQIKYCHRDIEEVNYMLTVSCGFDKVIPYRNATHGQDDFSTLMTQLTQEIKPAKKVLVLVYYAGHAVSIAGQSFLIPVDVTEGDLGKYVNVYEFLQPLHDLISERCEARAKRTAKRLSAEPVPGAVALLILDGCRTAPSTGEVSSQAEPAGAEQEMVHRFADGIKPTNSQFCFLLACDEGSGARECETTKHGFLSEAFLHCVEAFPGIGLPDLFERIVQRCEERTGYKQRPWVYSCCRSLSDTVLRQRARPRAAFPAPALRKEDLDRLCPDSAVLGTLQACVGQIEDMTKACQAPEPQELQTMLEMVQALVARLLRIQETLSQETLSVAVSLMKGLQCLLPQQKAVAALVTRVRACAWQEAARRLCSETALASDVQRGINEGRELLDQTSVTVAVVGPTSSGKSTLVNAYFGRMICPMGQTPKSLLPVAFTASAGVSRFEVVPQGCGLRGYLAPQLESMKLRDLTSDEAHELINCCNETIRRLIADGELSPESLPDFSSWHMEVLVPVPTSTQCFSIVDCPGGSEGGSLGEAASQFLQYQTREASLILLVPWL